MDLEKGNRDLRGSILLVFSSERCLRRHLPVFGEGKYKLFLLKEDSGLGQDVEIELTRKKNICLIGGKRLDGGAPFYFYTISKEKLLLLLAKKEDFFLPAVKIPIRPAERIKIGNDFKNQIFYDCFTLMEPCYAEIVRESGKDCENGYPEEDGREKKYRLYSKGNEGIYVNEESVFGEKCLQVGDRIDIYGLHLLLLKDMIVCVPFSGVCRGGKGWAGFGTALPAVGSDRGGGTWIERNCGQEGELHAGEMEIIPPEKRTPERQQPFILSVGPSLTMVLPMLVMAWAGSRFMGEMGSGFYYMSVIMSGCSALLALFWAMVGQGYQKYAGKQERKEKERQYREYLNEMENWILSCQQDNRKLLEMKYPPVQPFIRNFAGKSAGMTGSMPLVLWNRYYRQKDFLFLRLGIGDEPFQVAVKLSGPQKNIVEGKLAGEARELALRYELLRQVPIGVDLFINRQIGMAGGFGRDGVCGLLLQLLIQTAVCHCYTEVKIVCFYDKNRERDRIIASHCKWMPHSWSKDKRVRYLAGDEREAGEILPCLTRELTALHMGNKKEVKIPWYIVFVLEEEWIRGEPLYGYLTESIENYPVSAVFAGRKREELPKSCRYFIQQKEKGGEILDLGKEKIYRQEFWPEVCMGPEPERYLRKTAGFKVREAVSEGQIPEKVSFLELFGCTRMEELESGRRWKDARPEERLKVPIGGRAGGNTVCLDVHEKFHGPHGLIAGTTGSGKSELIQTYLLSIAVSFSPLDVNFFMIDYKGGGTGNLLKGLPHCAGVISNLSGRQIKRAMSAITSENKRRQKLLGSYQINHIDGYTRLYREGRASRPMPHLLLVVDEFAELKKEEPEFMQEIISLAQVGRSLGVHLILATQKPAGTVDDKIWSNARFRLCLRVQDKQDSMDMLHNGDAASLSLPGQCYLQIGNHEYYELFQAGYCGGIYRKEGEKKARAALVSNTGKRWEKIKECREEGGSLMDALMDYINRTAEESGCPKAAALWMPELPKRILLEELKESDIPVEAVLLGLCDDPANQSQPVLTYDPKEQGHLAVCGGPSTGKSTMLQTILWQLCCNFTPDEMVFVIAAIGQEETASFHCMPHCLGVLKEQGGKSVFFYHLQQLADKRKKLLAGTNWQRYNQSGRKKLPLVFWIIDDFTSLKKEMEENQEEFLIKLAAEGIGIGIYLIISAAEPGDLGAKLFEKIKMTLALEMSDRFQYGDILRQYFIPVLPEENRKGRGLCRLKGRILEFQTALIMKEQEGDMYFNRIKEESRRQQEEMYREQRSCPYKFPVLPEEADFATLIRDFEKQKKDGQEQKIPVGYDLATAEICSISLKGGGCFLISGRERTGRSTLLGHLAESVLHLGYQTVMVDCGRRFINYRNRTGVIYIEEAEDIEKWRQNTLEKQEKESEHWRDTCVFISSLKDFCRILYQSGDKREERVGFWERAAAGKGRICLLAGIYHPEKDYEAMGTEFFREFAGWQQGIHLGGNTAAQRALAFDDLSYALQNQYEPAGTGYLKEGAGSGTRHILLPGREVGNCY